MDADEQQYGFDQLIEHVHDARDVSAAVIPDVRRFGTIEDQDDRTLVVMKAT